MLAQDDEDRLAWIGEHAALDEIEQLLREIGGQIRLESQSDTTGPYRWG